MHFILKPPFFKNKIKNQNKTLNNCETFFANADHPQIKHRYHFSDKVVQVSYLFLKVIQVSKLFIKVLQILHSLLKNLQVFIFLEKKCTSIVFIFEEFSLFL